VGRLWRQFLLWFRPHRRRPLLSLVIVLSLVLGIGINAAVVSLVDALFVRPLPVEGMDRLVSVFRTVRQDSGEYTGRLRLSPASYHDFVARNRVLSGLVLFTWGPVNLSATGSEPVRATVMFTTDNYLDVLGLEPSMGRYFTPEEVDDHSDVRVAVLSRESWIRRFGADPDILGKTVRINGLPFTVVGVGPSGFRGTKLHVDVDAWVPLPIYRELGAAADWYDERDASLFEAFGRLAPGVSIQAARSELMEISHQLERDYPKLEKDAGVGVEPLLEGVMVSRERPSYVSYANVLVLAGAIVLLVSCLNVGMLLLLRGLERRQELAVRQVLGSSRVRLIGQLVGENLLLFLVGGLLSLPVAVWTLDLLWKFRPPRFSDSGLDMGIDSIRLGWALVIVAGVFVLAGVVPAWRTARTQLTRQISGSSELSTVHGWRVRAGGLLLVAQVALAMVALVATGLFVRHLEQESNIDLGFNPHHLAVLTVAPGDQGYPEEKVHQIYDALLDRARALPGVEGATLSENRLLRGGVLQRQVFLDGSQEPAASGNRLWHRTNSVVPGFFATAGIDLIEGRDFDATDRADGPRVAIVNRTMAETAWPGQDPLGKVFHFDYTTEPPVQVIGVAEDAKYRYIHEDPQFFISLPFSQEQPSAATLHVRTSGDPEDMLPALRHVVAEVDPTLPVADAGTMDSFFAEAIWLERASTGFLSVLSLLALVLVVIGIHAVMAYSVRRRMREFGVRFSLGAERGRIVRQVLVETSRWITAGAIVGAAGVFLVLRPAVAPFLNGVDPLPTALLLAAALAVVALAAAAGSLRPALQAARWNPARLLRDE